MTDETIVLSGGVTSSQQMDITVTDLAPNNYLTIVWGNTNSMDILKDLDIDEERKKEYTVGLRNAVESALTSGKISSEEKNKLSTKYLNIQAVARYLAQNTIPSGPTRTVANALINLASGNKTKFNEKTTNLIINVFGGITDKVARTFGFTDPHEVFATLSSENNIKFIKELCLQSDNFISNKIRELNGEDKTNTTSKIDGGDKKYIGLILGLTQSDTESYEITIPRRKVEDGSDYTTHLLPQPFKKEFSGYLTNRVLTSSFQEEADLQAIEYTKNKLIEIAKSRIPFDIYIRLSKDKMYKKTRVVFSSLSFTKDENSGNTYNFSFTIEPIETFKVQNFVSNRKYFPTASSSGSTSGTGSISSSGGKTSVRDAGGVSTSASSGVASKTSNGNSTKLNWGYSDSKMSGTAKDINTIKNIVNTNNKTLGKKYNLVNYIKNSGGLNVEVTENVVPVYQRVGGAGQKLTLKPTGVYALKKDCNFLPGNNVYTLKPNVSIVGNSINVGNGKTIYNVIKP